MKRIVATFLILYTVSMSTACPVSATSLAQAREASSKVAGYANAGVNLTRELYGANFLTLVQKDVVAKKFILLAESGIAFDLAVSALERQYGPSSPPNSAITRLAGLFDTQVVGAFLDILVELKMISTRGNYGEIIELIKAAVLMVAGVFGIKKSVGNKIQLAGV